MDQPLDFLQQQDRYGGVPLGVESAWPVVSGARVAVAQGLSSSSSSSSPKGDSGIRGAFSLRAAGITLAVLLLTVVLPLWAAPYESGDHAGTIEVVREVAIGANPAPLAEVFEHSVRAETGEAIVVRLDDGRLVTVVQEGAQRFQPGERVRFVGGRLLRT